MYHLPKIVFIAHPRTASRAVAQALQESGATQVAGHHGIDEDLCQTVVGGGGIVACATRNMFDLMVSWWCNQNLLLGTNLPLNANYQPFGQYLEEKAYHTNHRWFTDTVYHYGVKYSNFIIDYENLQGGFDVLMEKAGLPEKKLPVIGASKRGHYSEYYDAKLIGIVEDRWEDDLRLTQHWFETA